MKKYKIIIVENRDDEFTDINSALSELQVDIIRFHSIEEIQGEENANLAIIDLILNYREGMSRDEIVVQVKDTFESLSKREKMLGIPIVFITKAPKDIIADALKDLPKTNKSIMAFFDERDPKEIAEIIMINEFSNYIEINPKIVFLMKPYIKLRNRLPEEKLNKWKRKIREIIKQKLEANYLSS